MLAAIAAVAPLCLSVACVSTLADLGGIDAPIYDDSRIATESLIEITAIDTWFDSKDEYFLGRATAALILDQCSIVRSQDANRYVNTLGQYLALIANGSAPYNGYRFAILDTDEMSVFSTSGGHVFVSRGMVKTCSSEDELAAILAIEIMRISEHQHVGVLPTPQRPRFIGGLTGPSADPSIAGTTSYLAESVTFLADHQLGGSWGAKLNAQADAGAVVLITIAGYDGHALERVLESIGELPESEAISYERLHGRAEQRLRELRRAAETLVPSSAHRTAIDDRFAKILAGL